MGMSGTCSRRQHLTAGFESTGDQLSRKEMMILMPCARHQPTILSRPSTASQFILPADNMHTVDWPAEPHGT